MEIKPADLVLVRGTGPVADAIEGITRSPYSHMAGLVKPNELIEAQGFRPTGYQALDFYAGAADVYTCDMLTTEQRFTIWLEVSKQVGKHYSYLLIVWELLRYTIGIVIQPGADWQPIICSTLWARAYHAAGIDLCPGVLFPTPADIAASPLLKQIGSI